MGGGLELDMEANLTWWQVGAIAVLALTSVATLIWMIVLWVKALDSWEY
jgi:hypothetical protein